EVRRRNEFSEWRLHPQLLNSLWRTGASKPESHLIDDSPFSRGRNRSRNGRICGIVHAQIILAQIQNETATYGVGFGSVLAIVCSWQRNRSILWAILAGILSWIYVIYFAPNSHARCDKMTSVKNRRSDVPCQFS